MADTPATQTAWREEAEARFIANGTREAITRMAVVFNVIANAKVVFVLLSAPFQSIP